MATLSLCSRSHILHDFLFLFFESYIFHLGVSSLPWLTRARDGRGRGNVSLRRGWSEKIMMKREGKMVRRRYVGIYGTYIPYCYYHFNNAQNLMWLFLLV
ncbi:hypothetical protein IGI04_038225 [Brassica rapa subsp. trilocularis]|uniref:Uncharacterized protein n=1 Tax=Brassica rapa subsp. trilocularis TaxID=1813537 RepID=A0ABQ7LM92_BRACM|nr:hypothetical protein IGI04_038225 [Brassica rapa subsp. trilocularis]